MLNKEKKAHIFAYVIILTLFILAMMRNNIFGLTIFGIFGLYCFTQILNILNNKKYTSPYKFLAIFFIVMFLTIMLFQIVF